MQFMTYVGIKYMIIVQKNGRVDYIIVSSFVKCGVQLHCEKLVIHIYNF